MKLMKTITLLMLALVASAAQDANWQKLKSIDAYAGSEYNLRKDVVYMEIRFYKSKKSKHAHQTLQLYRKPLSSYPKETISKFRALPQRHTDKESYLQIRDNGNAFFIDTKGKMFWTDENKDIRLLLGEIDRPAEVALLLSLKWKHKWQYCKKINRGYLVKMTSNITKCIKEVRTSHVSKGDMGNYFDGDTIFHIERGASCNRRKNTRFITNKKVDYESYRAIDMDSKGNLYAIGYVKKDKTYSASEYFVLDKYSNNGKKQWSKKIKDGTDISVRVVNDWIYTLDGHKIVEKYGPNGKRLAYAGEKVLPKNKKGVKKYKIAIPGSEKKTTASVIDYVADKKGNIYVVGVEYFYPYGMPGGSFCGNTGELEGANITKLNSRGQVIWARVIDRDD